MKILCRWLNLELYYAVVNLAENMRTGGLNMRTQGQRFCNHKICFRTNKIFINVVLIERLSDRLMNKDDYVITVAKLPDIRYWEIKREKKSKCKKGWKFVDSKVAWLCTNGIFTSHILI